MDPQPKSATNQLCQELFFIISSSDEGIRRDDLPKEYNGRHNAKLNPDMIHRHARMLIKDGRVEMYDTPSHPDRNYRSVKPI